MELELCFECCYWTHNTAKVKQPAALCPLHHGLRAFLSDAGSVVYGWSSSWRRMQRAICFGGSSGMHATCMHDRVSRRSSDWRMCGRRVLRVFEFWIKQPVAFYALAICFGCSSWLYGVMAPGGVHHGVWAASASFVSRSRSSTGQPTGHDRKQHVAPLRRNDVLGFSFQMRIDV
jgi:hypothetical protein